MELDDISLKFIHAAYSKTIFPLSEMQKAWCMNNIDPVLDDLQAIVEMAREDVDRRILKKLQRKNVDFEIIPGFKHPYDYPEGYCDDISNGVYLRLKGMMKRDSSSAISMLKRARDNKIPFRPIYGILQGSEGKVFQNAIQLGDKIIDSAFDTGLDTNVQKVFIWNQDSGIISSIESYTDYSKVKEEYHHDRVYPTYGCFPFLAPLIPALVVSPTSLIHFINYPNLFYENICQGFRLSREFLENPHYANRTVPAKLKNYFSRKFGKRKDIFMYRENGVSLENSFQKAIQYWGDVLKGIPLEIKEEKYQSAKNVLQISKNLEALMFYDSN